MLEGTAGRASELKQQGALEAAGDPNSSVTAEQAEKTVLHEAKVAGAPAFEFNPDASPEEKARQIKEVAGERPHRKHKTAALVTDQDNNGLPDYDLPAPSKEGAIAIPSSSTAGSADGQPPAHEDEYSKVGWAPRFGNPGDKDDGGTLLDHQDWLESKIDDKFYGDWYHNAGVIIFACLASWTVAMLGGGLGWVFIVMATCGTYYRTSIRRVRRNFRDDVHRELAKNRLETDTETLEWINSFLVKFWPIYAPVLCTTIIQSVDQVLSTSTPAFLDSIRMKSFTLGTKPPRLEHVKTYPKADDDTVLMDWKFSFTPNDTADLTARQIKNKINPKVVLEVRIGKAMISKGLDIIVEDMAVTGTMRIKLKLQLPFPHLERADICFLGRPKFDYVCKPIGGDMLGFDINFIPGLEGFIQEQIHANLGPMMYDPNVFPIEIAKMLAGTAVDQAIGVLQVTFHGAQGLKNPDKFSGTPDPYATVSINNRDVLGKTKIVTQSANPRWNETINVIITSLHEPLTIHVFDYNEYRKDKELGVCTFSLEDLEHENEHENLQLEVIASGRPRGIVQADIRFFPVLEGHKLEDGTVAPPPESSTGIVNFTVEQAKDLDGTKSLIGQLNPYAVLLLNGKEVHVSQKLKRTNNPIWPNASKEMLITDRKKAKLGLVIKDDRELGADPVIGTYQITLDDMLDLMSKGQEWYNLAGANTGRVKMTLQWKPVALKGALGGSGGYITPIGVMRFHFKSAQGLKNLDTIGKSDPYARVLLSGIQKGRTVTWNNNLNPEWDEVCYVPVHTPRETLVVEVMDEETTQKDRTMGQIEIKASDYVIQGDDGEYLVHDTKNENIAAQLRIGHSPPKGVLNFTVAFYPCLPVVDPEEEERDQEKARASQDTNAGRPSLESAPKTPTTSASGEPNGRPQGRSDTSGTISSLKTASSTNGEKDVQKLLAKGETEQRETEDVKSEKTPKIRITADDLSKYESGLLIFKLIEGTLAHSGTYLEVVMDDNLFPSYTSSKARGHKFSFNETGDAMIRELDLSRITLRLVSKVDKRGDDKEDQVVAKITGQTLDVIKRALYTPTQIALKDKEGHESKITVSMRFLPVKMQLDPSESFNNSGTLRVEVLDADDLPSADRNGFSDPYCKFSLNGKEVYKTKVQKKTLHPAWNEFFETPVRSRTAAKFDVVVLDWDAVGEPDYLGSAAINLEMLEPFQAQEVTLGLDGKSGSIRLKMVFKPDYVTRSRQGSSTFSGTFAAPGKVIGAPVKGVGKGAVLVGGGVAKGASFLGKSFKRRTTSGSQTPQIVAGDGANGTVAEMRDTSMETNMATAATTAEADGHSPQVSLDSIGNRDSPQTPHQRQKSFGAVSATPGGAEAGTATLTVLGASGFEGEPKLEVHIYQDTARGSKEVLKTDHPKAKNGEVKYEGETKRWPCNADSQFHLQVVDHKTFGSEKLGQAVFFINNQGQGGDQTVKVGNTGSVLLRTSFQPAETGSIMAGGSESPASSRKGGFGRLVSRKERSVTPSG